MKIQMDCCDDKLLGMRTWPYWLPNPQSLKQCLEFSRHSTFVHCKNGSCQNDFWNIIAQIFSATSAELNCDRRRLNGLHRGFLFICVMISKAAYIAKIFLLLLWFSLRVLQ